MANEITPQILSRLEYKEIDTTPNLFQSNYNGRRVIQRYPESNLASLNNNAIWTLSPTSFQPGAFTSNPITIRLQPNFCNLITDAHLQLTVSESGGANSVTPICAPFLIQRIEISLNSSVIPEQTIYPEWLYSKYQFYYNEETTSALAFNAQNMNTSFAGEQAIPAGGTATYLLPLTNSLLNSIDPSTISSDVIITIYPAVNPVVSGTGTLQLTSVQLLLDSEQNPVVEAATRSLLRSNPMIHNYLNFVPQPWNGQLTAGTMTEIPISGVNQLVAAALITVRASKAITGAAIRTFADLGDSAIINVTDQNKVSILGSGGLQGRYLRGQQMAFKTHGTQSAIIPLYWILHSDIQEALATGRIAGFYNYDGYQYLQITPGAGFSSGLYNVDIMFLCYNSQLESGGEFRRLN